MSVQNILPIIWVIGSTLAFVTMQVFIKILSFSISPQYIISLRSILLLLFNSVLVFGSDEYEPYNAIPEKGKQKVSYFRLNIKNRKYFILMMKRLFWNAVSINCFLASLKYVHISIANALLNTTPVLTFFVEAFYFQKSINPINLGISLVCFIGVILILNPASELLTMSSFNWHLILPLIAAFSNCLNWIYLHEMKSQFNEILVLEYTYVTHLITSSLIMIIFGTMDNTGNNQNFQIFTTFSFYLEVLMMVVLAYITHLLRIKATFKRKPSEILAFNYLGILYSILIDDFYFKTHLAWITIIGVFLTGSGLLSKLLLEFINKKQIKTVNS